MLVAGTTVSFSCGLTLPLVVCPISLSEKAGQSACGHPRVRSTLCRQLEKVHHLGERLDRSNCKALPA